MDIEEIRALVADIATRRSVEPLTGKVRAEITKFNVELTLNYRLYMLADKSQASILWDRIRNDQVLLHYVLSATNEFLIRLGGDDQTWQDLITIIASSAGIHHTKNSSIDGATLDRLPSNVTDLYSGNPWIVFLVILESILDFKS